MTKTAPAKLAQVKVKYAVDNGKIIKPKNCKKCGQAHPNLHAHHPDYSEPLEVNWLCPSCHASEHPKKSSSESFLSMTRQAIGLSQTKMACLLGVPLRSYQNWEYGVRRVPGWIDKFLKMLPR